MRRIGRVGWTARFGILAVAMIVILLSAVACEREPAVSEEPAATQEPVVSREPAVTQKPATTPEPVATPQIIIKKVERVQEVLRSAEGSRVASCGRAVSHIWGSRGGGVGWSRRLSGDEIVFTAGLEVYAVGADGVGLRMISEAVDEGAPPDGTTTLDVSADGREVVYSPCERLNGRVGDSANYEQELAVASLDGTQPRRLTENKHFDNYPSWSPDGTRIAFLIDDGYYTGGGRYVRSRLVTMAADGTDEKWIEIGHEVRLHPPQWSPDGTRLAVVGRHPDQRRLAIYTMGADGSDVRRLGVAASGPSWSPDGERIAFATVDGDELVLYTMAADGTDVKVLVAHNDDGGMESKGVVEGDISADIAACAEGWMVPNPEANRGLVQDCEALVVVQNALAGPGGLNWLVDRNIAEWEGVAVGGSPPRVEEVKLTSRGLSGAIPSELGGLTELRVLDLRDNYRGGEIPAELGKLAKLTHVLLQNNYLGGVIPRGLGDLSELEYLKLSGNQLTGCIPAGLREVENTDVGALGLPDC